ncbi:MAG: PP2C family protein-serine/threonine phosphatase [Gemmataceae bacterium]
MSSPDDTIVLKRSLIPDFPRPYSSLVRVEFGAMTHVGRVRKNNEDSYLVFKTGRAWERVLTSLKDGEVPERFDEVGYVMAVADGMGGTAGGEVASALALRAAVSAILNAPNWALKLDHPEFREAAVEKAIERGMGYFKAAHEAILKQAQGGGPGVDRMGTTLTATYSFGRDLFILHVGDSRAYRHRAGELTRLTRDHTMAQDLVDSGALSEEEASGHRFSHILTRALSAQTESVKAEVGSVELRDGDVVLLCSDGLSGMVSDADIGRILGGGGSPARLCQELVDAALAAGGRDNITAVIARYQIPPD